MNLITQVALGKAERLLSQRLGQLEERLQAGDEGAWSEFLQVVSTLATLLPSLAPERGGPMLSTAQMAGRMGISPKTLLRHKKNGKIEPTLQKGRLIRWNGSEGL